MLLLHYNHFMAFWILFGTTRVSRYQKGKTNLDLLEQEGNEWQWHRFCFYCFQNLMNYLADMCLLFR